MNKTIPRIEVDKNTISIFHIEQNPSFSYDIPIYDFKKRNEFWIKHLKGKNWFTEEMEKELNERV